MKLNWKRLALIVAGFMLAYLAVPFPFLREASRSDVRESAIRWLLHHNGSGLQNRLQVCFIGTGTTFDPQDEDFGPHDPPREFVNRFTNFPVPTLPPSARTNLQQAGTLGGYVADTHGRPGLVLAAGNVTRWSLGLVVCRGLYYEGGLSAAGYDIYILRLPFVWVPVWAHTLWIA